MQFCFPIDGNLEGFAALTGTDGYLFLGDIKEHYKIYIIKFIIHQSDLASRR
jgi:hypothetical protein